MTSNWTRIMISTSDEWYQLINYLESTGHTWSSGALPTERYYWEDYRENTVILIDKKTKKMGYSSYTGPANAYGADITLSSYDYINDDKGLNIRLIEAINKNLINT